MRMGTTPCGPHHFEGAMAKETMTLKTAADLYDVKLSTLRLMCLRGKVKSTKPGKLRFVTTSEMDRVFKGIVTASPKGVRASK